MHKLSFKNLGSALFLTLLTASPIFAQGTTASSEPAIRRWLDVQQLTLYSRYRFVDNNKTPSVTTADQLQYKDSIRARVNLDPQKRFTINAGFFSGSNFTSSWDNWGVGTGGNFDGQDNYVKQLYASAIPVPGVEGQAGGLYVTRGEQDEWISFDDDGFIMGERATVKRPKTLYFDELTLTRGALGPLTQPDIGDRWNSFTHQNYTQALAVKKFNATFAASASYERQIGTDIARAAITVHLAKTAPVNTIRYEQYHRFNGHAASGFAVWADRSITKYLRLQGGYVTVDQFYGGWNADRMQLGRRFFAAATIPIWGPISASLYGTQALHADYAITIRQRFDAVISYDLLDTLRRARIF